MEIIKTLIMSYINKSITKINIMKTLYYLLAIVLFFSVSNSIAQQKLSKAALLAKGSLKMEAINKEQSKFFEGKYCLLNLTDKNSKEAYPLATPYAVILFKKSMIVGATTLQFYFKRENQPSYVISIPNNSSYVTESSTNSDVAAIYMGTIQPDFKKNKLIEPVFYADEDIASAIEGVTESDLASIKEKMASKIFEKK